MPALEGNDELSEEASNEIQEQIPQEKQRGIDERLTQGEVRRIPLQQDMAHPEKRSRPQDPDVQRQAANTIQNQAGDRDMGLSPVRKSIPKRLELTFAYEYRRTPIANMPPTAA